MYNVSVKVEVHKVVHIWKSFIVSNLWQPNDPSGSRREHHKLIYHRCTVGPEPADSSCDVVSIEDIHSRIPVRNLHFIDSAVVMSLAANGHLTSKISGRLAWCCCIGSWWWYLLASGSIVVKTLVSASELSLSCASWMGDHFVVKPSAIGQPTWPTQPSIPQSAVKLTDELRGEIKTLWVKLGIHVIGTWIAGWRPIMVDWGVVCLLAA